MNFLGWLTKSAVFTFRLLFWVLNFWRKADWRRISAANSARTRVLSVRQHQPLNQSQLRENQNKENMSYENLWLKWNSKFLFQLKNSPKNLTNQSEEFLLSFKLSVFNTISKMFSPLSPQENFVKPRHLTPRKNNKIFVKSRQTSGRIFLQIEAAHGKKNSKQISAKKFRWRRLVLL